MKKPEAFAATLLAAGPKPPKGKDSAGHRRLRNWEQFAGHILYTLRDHKQVRSPFERIRRNTREFQEFLDWLPQKAK